MIVIENFDSTTMVARKPIVSNTQGWVSWILAFILSISTVIMVVMSMAKVRGAPIAASRKAKGKGHAIEPDEPKQPAPRKHQKIGYKEFYHV